MKRPRGNRAWYTRKLLYADTGEPAPPEPHPFIIYRLGLDACAKCGKPRVEHHKP